MRDSENIVQQDHWSERGRATSVANADALGRPRRSVLPLVETIHEGSDMEVKYDKVY